MTTNVDFISKIYPGAQITIGRIRLKTITKFYYELNHNFDIVAIHIYDNIQVKDSLKFNNGKILLNETEVYLISKSNDILANAWASFSHNVFIEFMSFMYENFDYNITNERQLLHFTIHDFELVLKNRWSQFTFFVAKDQCNFLIKYFDSAFSQKIIHSSDCTDQNHIYDSDHVCNPAAHLRVLFDVALNPNTKLIQTKDSCLAAVIIISGIPQYIHITPYGSFITDNGACRHPLTRIIFWIALLQIQPIYLTLFKDKYHENLNYDLKYHMFNNTSCLTINEMIQKFDDKRCLNCSHYKRPALPLITGWNIINPSPKTCNYEHKYNYHYKLLSLIKICLMTNISPLNKNITACLNNKIILKFNNLVDILTSHELTKYINEPLTLVSNELDTESSSDSD